MSDQADTPIEWSNKHLRLAIEAARVAMWSWNVDDNSFRMDPRGFELWGLEWSESVEFEELSAHIHPADRDRVREAFVAPPGQMISTSAVLALPSPKCCGAAMDEE